jgi:hypothetical protein
MKPSKLRILCAVSVALVAAGISGFIAAYWSEAYALVPAALGLAGALTVCRILSGDGA